MTPLRPLALGLAIVALQAPVAGWDLLADPLGWTLVLVGTRALPWEGPWHRRTLAVEALALAVAVATWPPAVGTRLADADASLGWAASLPQLAAVLLLARGLADLARSGQDRGAAAWWATMQVGAASAAILPVVVLGGGVDALAGPTVLVADLVLVGSIILLAVHASRPWARGTEGRMPRSPTKSAEGS